MRRSFALACALALLGAGTLAIAAPAAAAPRHVGVVIRYGNGRISAGCATVGGTGLQVLGQHHSVRMGTQQYSGFLITIDNVGTTRPDNTHYWSYWHSGGRGSWTYASSGAASYRPKAGTVEGWSYVNGQSSAPKPPSRTYAALCGHLDPHAAPRSTAASTSAPSSASSTATATFAVPVASSTSTRPIAPSTTASQARSRAVSTAAAPAPHTGRTITRARASGSPVARRRHHSHRPHPASTAPTSTAAPAAATSSAPATIAAEPAADTSSSNAWPTIGALAVVAALGLTAWLVMHRRAG